MKRREILKMLGVGAFSLTGIERLAKAMATSKPSSTDVCVEEVEVVCVVSASSDEGYTFAGRCPILVTCPLTDTCDNAAQHSCGSFECLTIFTCDTNPGGDFNCVSQFQGCGWVGSFHCKGSDPADAQFNCSVRFTGCQGGGAFRCDDFDCVNTYDCGQGKVCPAPAPFPCQNPPHGRFSCPAGYNS